MDFFGGHLSWYGMILLFLVNQAGAAFRSGVKGQINHFEF